MVKKIKKVMLVIVIILVLLTIFATNVRADSSSNLYLNKLNFDVYINEDGSMDVTETWNISIKNTNTLYKTFKEDKEKYTSIENVKVKDITAGKVLEKIDEEMYHVTKGCYYGLVNSKGDFEIAWGVGLDNSRDTRVYEISYTVKDAVAKYTDYAELYWQFVGENFEVDAGRITGTIILPKMANSTDDIKVWGHTENLNGEIYVTNTNQINFQIENFNSGRYVEVRTLFPTNLIMDSKRTYNENRYDSVVKEETEWANQANMRRKWEEIKDEVIFALFALVVLVLCVVFIKRTLKYKRKLQGISKYKPDQQLEYYRELPEKNTTPGEAVYILKEPYSMFLSHFGRIFSATLLDLKLKKYLDLRVQKEGKKDKIYIKRLKEADEDLKPDEKNIFEFISKAYKEKEEIEIKELEKYITSHSSSVEALIQKSKKNIEKQLIDDEKFNEKEKNEYMNYSKLAVLYFMFAMMTLLFLFYTVPLSIVLFINGILCSKIKKRINILTQKGINEKEKWKGLQKYMEDFSLLNEKEVPAIEIWEHFLVYATAFGIADKVLEQLKTIYPHIDELGNMNTSAYMYFMYHSNFSSNFANSINSSISSAYSSATGGGGGFSGGGGGGRWPEEAVEADKKIYICSPKEYEYLTNKHL